MMLNLYQKRQATLLTYFSSMAYLDRIIERVRALTAFTDTTLEYAQRVARDEMMQQFGWTEEHLSSNWTAHAHPMLQGCLRGLQSQKTLRMKEAYDISGVSSALIGMDYFSMNWTLPEEEKRFRELENEASALGDYLDSTILHTWHDYYMTWVWEEVRTQFPRLLKYRIRTDIVAESGKRPIRTGVYVPQDDEFGTLQFAWTGDSKGTLAQSDTLSDLAREYANEVGRAKLWTLPEGETPIPGRAACTTAYFDNWCRKRKGMVIPESISSRNPRAFVYRPCKWFYVERIDGEYDTLWRALPKEGPSDVYIVPEAARPWLSNDLRQLLDKNKNAILTVSKKNDCKPYDTRLSKSGKPVNGMVCKGADRYLLYMMVLSRGPK